MFFDILALLKLRNYDHALVEAELNDLADEKYRLSQQAKLRWVDFYYNKALARPLIVAIVLHMTQQFSGRIFLMVSLTFLSSIW